MNYRLLSVPLFKVIFWASILLLPQFYMNLALANEVTDDTSYAKLTIPSVYCKRAEYNLSLSHKDFKRYIDYYTNKHISQRLLLNQILCDLGKPSHDYIAKKNKEFLTHKMIEGERIIQYGEFLTNKPTVENSLILYVGEDGVVRTLIHLKPFDKKQTTVIKLFEENKNRVVTGSYTAVRN